MSQPKMIIAPATLGVEASTTQDIWDILVEANTSFTPALSTRGSATQTSLAPSTTPARAGPVDYFESIRDQHFIIARTTTPDETVAGFMSFRRDYHLPGDRRSGPYLYVTTVIVRAPFRGHRITQRMYEVLLNDARTLDQGVATRTWSTNSAHIKLLSALGFAEVHRIPDDRGSGVDTVYFAKDI